MPETVEDAISIHAPRTGSDYGMIYYQLEVMHFNPRSPHGERQFGRKPDCRFRHISIHAPRTGSDLYHSCLVVTLRISIHAPRTGSDGPPGRTTALRSDFNPRSPHGERPI